MLLFTTYLQFYRDETAMTETKNIIMNSFPNAELDEEFGELLHYKIPQSDIKSLADSFAVLEKGKLR